MSSSGSRRHSLELIDCQLLSRCIRAGARRKRRAQRWASCSARSVLACSDPRSCGRGIHQKGADRTDAMDAPIALISTTNSLSREKESRSRRANLVNAPSRIFSVSRFESLLLNRAVRWHGLLHTPVSSGEAVPSFEALPFDTDYAWVCSDIFTIKGRRMTSPSSCRRSS
jgi:hypothetical protein